MKARKLTATQRQIDHGSHGFHRWKHHFHDLSSVLSVVKNPPPRGFYFAFFAPFAVKFLCCNKLSCICRLSTIKPVKANQA